MHNGKQKVKTEIVCFLTFESINMNTTVLEVPFGTNLKNDDFTFVKKIAMT